MLPQKQKKPKKGTPAWMVSYGDMTTLLLTFFIVLTSFAEIDGKDFYLVLSSFRGSLGMFQGGYSLSSGRLEELGQNMLNLPSNQKGSALSKSVKKAVSLFQPEIKTRKVRVSEDERGLIITLSSDAYFDPGSAVLKNEVRPILSRAAEIINSMPNFVRIEGHTDNKPISDVKDGKGYSSNWELSSMRSVNVLRFLQEEEGVNPKKMSAAAYGEQRPLHNNDTPEGRAYNRRVDLLIVRDRVIQVSEDKRIERPLPDEEWR